MKEFNYTKAMTHAGVFHGDDVMAAAIINMINPSILVSDIERVNRVPDDVSEDTLVFDIGGGEYDHHQKGGNGCRENEIPYASAGLIWRDFGYLVEPDEDIRNKVDNTLIAPIDAIDNGFMLYSELPVPTVSSLISAFNPVWNSDEEPDTAFAQAVFFAMGILYRTLDKIRAAARAKDIVQKAVTTRAHKNIVTLPCFVPWQTTISEMEEFPDLMYIIFPSNRGGFNVQAVPESPGSFICKKPLPESWRGLNDEKLQWKSGIATATFCHPAGFIAGALTLDDAIKMAKEALNESND